MLTDDSMRNAISVSGAAVGYRNYSNEIDAGGETAVKSKADITEESLEK